jgi:hypothetical protein
MFFEKHESIIMSKMGPTGFDRMRDDVDKHAGSWDESPER